MRPFPGRPDAVARRAAPLATAERRARGGSRELRCGGGSPLARRVDAGVELKCRRCKRTIVLPPAGG